jgi:uncharacterized membrane protein YccC
MFAEQRYKSRLDRLIREWVEYRNLVANRHGAPDISPEEENRFLALKGKIAEDVTAVVHNGSGAGLQEMLSHQRSLGEFMTHYPTLAAPNAVSDREREEFEREWHRLFLFLNKLKGMPARKEAKPLAAAARPVSMPMPRFGPRFSFFGWLFRFAVRLAVLVVAAWVVVRYFPWERVGLRPNADAGNLPGSVNQAWDTARHGVSNLHVPTLGGVFQPVVDRYGPEITAVMVGVLFVAIGYWIFIRTK